MHPAIPILVIGALAALLHEPVQAPSAQLAREHIVLLPDADGSVGAITVTTARGRTDLDRAYAGVVVDADGTVENAVETAASVQQRYAAALAARPPAPVSFSVFFVFDKDELMPESLAEFERIKAELARRPAPEIVVIGHTDRVGSLEYNDALSLQRAQMVRSALAAAGIAAEQIEVSGRGEREPAVATEDEVAEPRNRRVEITVR